MNREDQSIPQPHINMPLHVILSASGLEYLFWSKTLEDNFGAGSANSLRHFGEEEWSALHEHVRHEWETKAVNDLKEKVESLCKPE